MDTSLVMTQLVSKDDALQDALQHFERLMHVPVHPRLNLADLKVEILLLVPRAQLLKAAFRR